MGRLSQIYNQYDILDNTSNRALQSQMRAQQALSAQNNGTEVQLDQTPTLKNYGFGEKLGATLTEVGGDITVGLLKGIEGLFDFSAMVTGWFGDEDYKRRVQEFIQKDYSGDLIQGNEGYQKAIDASWSKDMSETGQKIFHGVGQGVGRMLPDVALMIGTAGASAGVQTAVKGVTLAGLGMSAAGSGTEEAFNNGADYTQASIYGVLDGALEVATEKMFGALTAGGQKIFGAGAFDKITTSAVEKFTRAVGGNKAVTKFLLDIGEEGIEEMVSEFVEPYLRKLTFDPNADPATIQEILEAGLIGSLTAGVMNGGDVVLQNSTRKGRIQSNLAKAEEAQQEYIKARNNDNVEVAKQAQQERAKYLNKAQGEMSSLSEDKRAGLLDIKNENKNKANRARYYSKFFDEKGNLVEGTTMTDEQVKKVFDNRAENKEYAIQGSIINNNLSDYEENSNIKRENIAKKTDLNEAQTKFSTEIADAFDGNVNVVWAKNTENNTVFDDNTNGKQYAKYNPATDTVILSADFLKDYKTLDKKASHEVVAHFLASDFIKNSQIQSQIVGLFKGMSKTHSELYNQIAENLVKNGYATEETYVEDGKTYKRLAPSESLSKNERYRDVIFREEQVGAFIEAVFNGEDNYTLLHHLANKNKSLIGRIKALIEDKKNGVQTKKGEFAKFYSKQIKEFEDMIDFAIKNRDLTDKELYERALKETGEELDREERYARTLLDKYKDLKVEEQRAQTEIKNKTIDAFMKGLFCKPNSRDLIDDDIFEKRIQKIKSIVTKTTGNEMTVKILDMFGNNFFGATNSQFNDLIDFLKSRGYKTDGKVRDYYIDENGKTETSMGNKKQIQYTRTSDEGLFASEVLIVKIPVRENNKTIYQYLTAEIEWSYKTPAVAKFEALLGYVFDGDFTTDKAAIYRVIVEELNKDEDISKALELTKDVDGDIVINSKYLPPALQALELKLYRFYDKYAKPLIREINIEKIVRRLKNISDKGMPKEFKDVNFIIKTKNNTRNGFYDPISGDIFVDLNRFDFYKIENIAVHEFEHHIFYFFKQLDDFVGSKNAYNISVKEFEPFKTIIADIRLLSTDDSTKSVLKKFLNSLNYSDDYIKRLFTTEASSQAINNYAKLYEYMRDNLTAKEFSDISPILNEIENTKNEILKTFNIEGIWNNKVKDSELINKERLSKEGKKNNKLDKNTDTSILTNLTEFEKRLRLNISKNAKGELNITTFNKSSEMVEYLIENYQNELNIEEVNEKEALASIKKNIAEGHKNKARAEVRKWLEYQIKKDALNETINSRYEFSENEYAINKDELIKLYNEFIKANEEAINKEIEQQVKEMFAKTITSTKELKDAQKQVDRLKNRVREVVEVAKYRNRLWNKMRNIKTLLDPNNTKSKARITMSANSLTTLYKQFVSKIGRWQGTISYPEFYKFVDFVSDAIESESLKDVVSDFYPSLVDDLKELQLQRNKVMTPNNGFMRYSVEWLELANRFVDETKHLMTHYDNVFINGKQESLSKISKEGVDKMKVVRVVNGNRYNNKIGDFITHTVDPRTALLAMTGFDESNPINLLFKDVQKGEIEYHALFLDLSKDLSEFMDDRNNRNRIKKETIALEVTDRIRGKISLNIPVAVAVDLYMMLQQEETHKGFNQHGFKYLDEKTKSTYEILGTNIEESATEMRDYIASQFNETDKKYMSLIRKLFDNLTEAKKEMDLKLFGLTNVIDNYYPIVRNKDEIPKNFADVRSYMQTIYNISNNIARKENYRGLNIQDSYEKTMRTAELMSKYAKMGVQIDALGKVLGNVVKETINSNESKTTMNAELKAINGKAQSYVEKLLLDLISPTNNSSEFVRALRGLYATSALGANPKVWFSQLASIPAYLNNYGIGTLTKGIAKGFSVEKFKKMKKYSPYLRVRFEEAGVTKAEGLLDNIGKVSKALTKPIQFGDALALMVGWNCAEIEVAKNNPNLNKNSSEFYKKVAERCEEVSRLTQPQYLTTERSGMQRGGEIEKILTMFTSVSQKYYSMITTAIGRHSYDRRKLKAIESGKIKVSDTELQELKVRLNKDKTAVVKAVSGVVTANLIFALIGQLFKSLLHKDRKDKEGNEIGIGEDFALDFAGTMVGMIPIAKQVYDFYARGYDFEDFTFSMANDVLSSTSDFVTAVTKQAKGEEVAQATWNKTLRDLLFSTSTMLGLPVRNIWNTAVGLGKYSDEFAVGYGYAFSTKNTYAKDLAKAIENGDSELAETIINHRLTNGGLTTSTETNKELARLYSLGYSNVLPKSIGNTITYDNEIYDLDKSQKQQFRNIYEQAEDRIANLTRSQLFKQANDEVKAKAIKTVYDYYYTLAVKSIVGDEEMSKLELFAGLIPIEKLAIIVRLCQEAKDDDKKGSRKLQIMEIIDKQNLTNAEKYMLMGYLGYSNTSGKSQVESYIKRKYRNKTDVENLLKYSGYTA